MDLRKYSCWLYWSTDPNNRFYSRLFRGEKTALLTFTVDGSSTKLDLDKHQENTGWVRVNLGDLDFQWVIIDFIIDLIIYKVHKFTSHVKCL